MKKTILTIALTIISLSLFSQNLSDIIKNYDKAIGSEQLSSHKSVLIEGSMQMTGMSMSLVVKEKKPDKLRQEIDFSGMKMITVINGDKGYMINPMMGSNDPTPLPESQIAQAKLSMNLSAGLSGQYAEGNVELVGEETFRGTQAYKLLMKSENGDINVFIDKDTYLIKGMQLTVTQQGMTQEVETVMSDYKDIDGVKIAMKIDAYVSGTYGYGTVFTRVEFNGDIDDSEFEIK